VDRWFDSKSKRAAGSLESSDYYQNSANNALFYARQLSDRIPRKARRSVPIAELKKFVEAKQREYNLRHGGAFSPDGSVRRSPSIQQVPTASRLNRGKGVSTGRCAASSGRARKLSARAT